jgi:hypothetical protein
MHSTAGGEELRALKATGVFSVAVQLLYFRCALMYDCFVRAVSPNAGFLSNIRHNNICPKHRADERMILEQFRIILR